MSRYPLVLSAVVSAPASRRPHPTFGIRTLWSFVRDGIGVDIGPDSDWHLAAREHRLLTDEALRVLKSEWTPEQLLNVLLAAIPEAERELITSDSPHIWAFGRHPEAPWTYRIADLFKLIDNPPSADGPGRRRSMSRDERNVAVREWLERHAAADPFAVTAERIARAVDCSKGAVVACPAWRVFEDSRKKMRLSAGRAVPLSEGMLAVLPDNRADRPDELAQLIEEQAADAARDARRPRRRGGDGERS